MAWCPIEFRRIHVAIIVREFRKFVPTKFDTKVLFYCEKLHLKLFFLVLLLEKYTEIIKNYVFSPFHAKNVLKGKRNRLRSHMFTIYISFNVFHRIVVFGNLKVLYVKFSFSIGFIILWNYENDMDIFFELQIPQMGTISLYQARVNALYRVSQSM